MPSASQYSNEAWPAALKSRQWEIGIKGGQQAWAWQLAWFRIDRPMSNLDACSRLGLSPCEGRFDGEAVHQGLEANAQWAQGPWRLGGGVTLLDAKRKGSTVEPSTNGRRPTNVPAFVLRAQAGWKIAAVPGLELQGQLSHEGKRAVLPDGSIELPAWTRVDAALRYDRKVGARPSWSSARHCSTSATGKVALPSPRLPVPGAARS